MNYVIDFHVHIPRYEMQTEALNGLMLQVLGSEKAIQEFNAKYSDPQNFVDLMKEEGVDYAVVLSEYAPLTTGISSHEDIADFCSKHAELIPFCSFNPYSEGNMVKNLYRLHDLGFQGIKLYPTYNHFYVNEPKMYPLYAVASDLKMPILIHTGTSIFKNSRLKYGNPIFVDDVAVDFPDLVLVMAHGGRTAWYDEAMALVRLHKNVYIDLAGLSLSKLLNNFPDLPRFSHKFVFGTDFPQIYAKKGIASIKKLGLSIESTNNILGNNAAKILKII